MTNQKMSDLMERRKVDIVCSRPSKSSSEGEFKLLHHSADRKSNWLGIILKEEYMNSVKTVLDRIMGLMQRH